MSDDFLGDRKKALEESFFAKQNAQLLDQMRSDREKLAAIDALARVSNIDDQKILHALVEQGVDTATWAALSLVPLVEVAWADGEVQPKERDAILAAAAEHGIQPGTPSHDLLESWLETPPGAQLFATWGAYVVGLAAQLSPPVRTAMRAEIAERARKVAEAAGGILGIGSVSESEKRALDRVEQPFEDL